MLGCGRALLGSRRASPAPAAWRGLASSEQGCPLVSLERLALLAGGRRCQRIYAADDSLSHTIHVNFMILYCNEQEEKLKRYRVRIVPLAVAVGVNERDPR